MERIDSSCWYMRLLTAITNAQSQLIGSVERKQLFDGHLNVLLELSDSEYRFIGGPHLDDEGEVFLRTHAITKLPGTNIPAGTSKKTRPMALSSKIWKRCSVT